MRCKGTKKNGEQCTRIIKEKDFCFQHKTSFQGEKPDECPVCCDDIDENDILECGHWVHMDCIKRSLKPECPMCRQPLKLSKDIMESIQKNSQSMNDEWEREAEEEIQQMFGSELLSHLLSNFAFDIMRAACTCDECSNRIADDILVVFQNV